MALTNQIEPPQCLIFTNHDTSVVKGNDVGHKWLGCTLLAGANGKSTLDFIYQLEVVSRAFFANKEILCDKKIRLAVWLRPGHYTGCPF